ncbi:hypothetical protein GCK72_024578 [Caenorhabditis remanei]|uniref:Uncharacterized protein n=1 Tax=Caenorhabditis remanei TaxID=31234 RepID=A0A6A5G034_CAERE|nr:hypothetical protein GCK72_024578 [Caenorhabditis remanei]KAF1748111.1 hypothetical protein GCK72_024578 [Caenorhabditis remanei]
MNDLFGDDLYFSGSAASISTSTAATISSPLFDMNVELEKIATTCLTIREHEMLSGDILRNRMARTLNGILVLEAQEVIGLAEMRDVLGFAPPGPWTNYRKPSKDEIEAASTIEEYYTLREPLTQIISLDSEFYLEKNVSTAVAFLNKRIPAIRTIYRNKLEEIRRRSRDANLTINRKEVDIMIDEFLIISERIRHAFYKWKPCKQLANQ